MSPYHIVRLLRPRRPHALSHVAVQSAAAIIIIHALVLVFDATEAAILVLAPIIAANVIPAAIEYRALAAVLLENQALLRATDEWVVTVLVSRSSCKEAKSNNNESKEGHKALIHLSLIVSL